MKLEITTQSAETAEHSTIFGTSMDWFEDFVLVLDGHTTVAKLDPDSIVRVMLHEG